MEAGIIGGTGKMGTLFAGVFERAGYTVLISGRKTRISPEDIAKTSDIVMISVPIRETVRMIERIRPYLSESQVLCDLTSLKTAPVEAMLQSRSEVIGLHPMFGPSVQSLRKQTIIVCPSRCTDASLRMLTTLFRNEGAHITISTPEEHDRIMAVVQGLTHFMTLSIAETMRRTGMNPQVTGPYMSPVYQIEMGIVGRLLSQDPVLYRDMLMLNPFVPAVLAACEHSVSDLRDIINGKNEELFCELFRENAKNFNGYCDKASEETDFLIKSLVGR